MEVVILVLQVLGIYVLLPVMIGTAIIAIYVASRSIRSVSRESSQIGLDSLICSIDADCPIGYICINGQCVPQSKGIISPAV